MLPPEMIDAQSRRVIVRRGANLNVITEGVIRVTSSDPAVLRVSQPYTDGSARFNAGGRAVASGEATLCVFGSDDQELYRVDVIVGDHHTGAD